MLFMAYPKHNRFLSNTSLQRTIVAYVLPTCYSKVTKVCGIYFLPVSREAHVSGKPGVGVYRQQWTQQQVSQELVPHLIQMAVCYVLQCWILMMCFRQSLTQEKL